MPDGGVSSTLIALAPIANTPIPETPGGVPLAEMGMIRDDKMIRNHNKAATGFLL
jgi:hypothetical protein